MSSGGNQESEPRNQRVARFSQGKWYCFCDQPAICLTASRNTPNRGRICTLSLSYLYASSLLSEPLVWRCPKNVINECRFYLFEDEHEAAQREESRIPQTPTSASRGEPNLPAASGLRNQRSSQQTPRNLFTASERSRVSRDTTNHDNDPQTPTSASRGEPNLPAASGLRDQRSSQQTPENPSTASKRRRVSRDTTNHDNNGDICDTNGNGNESFHQATMATYDPFAHSDQPSEHFPQRAGDLPRGRRTAQDHHRLATQE